MFPQHQSLLFSPVVKERLLLNSLIVYLVSNDNKVSSSKNATDKKNKCLDD